MPVVFAVGIVARKPVPELNSLPGALAPAAALFQAQVWRRAHLFPQSPVLVCLLREHPGAGKYAAAFSAGKKFVKPDLLVYWVAGNSNITNPLPDNAMLLGSFNSTRLPLPDEVAKAAGRLVLFSLADNEIVDISKPFRINDIQK